MKKVKLNDKEYKLKLTLRSFMLFEEIANKSVNEMNNRLKDMITLFYATLKANNRDEFDLSFDEFIDKLEKNANLLSVFTSLYNEATGTEGETTKKK